MCIRIYMRMYAYVCVCVCVCVCMCKCGYYNNRCHHALSNLYNLIVYI